MATRVSLFQPGFLIGSFFQGQLFLKLVYVAVGLSFFEANAHEENVFGVCESFLAQFLLFRSFLMRLTDSFRM